MLRCIRRNVLRPIQLKISLVAIQDFTQVSYFYILSCMMCEDV